MHDIESRKSAAWVLRHGAVILEHAGRHGGWMPADGACAGS